jgi:hypothetical protein
VEGRADELGRKQHDERAFMRESALGSPQRLRFGLLVPHIASVTGRERLIDCALNVLSAVEAR